MLNRVEVSKSRLVEFKLKDEMFRSFQISRLISEIEMIKFNFQSHIIIIIGQNHFQQNDCLEEIN